jgi:hypothetical protein
VIYLPLIFSNFFITINADECREGKIRREIGKEYSTPGQWPFDGLFS